MHDYAGKHKLSKADSCSLQI